MTDLYTARRPLQRAVIGAALALSALLCGCTARGAKPLSPATPTPTVSVNAPAESPPAQAAASGFYGETPVSAEKQRDILDEAEALLAQYRDILSAAETQTLPQASIDEIEDILARSGCPVINSDSFFPAYLENAEGIPAFWDCVNTGNDAATAFWGVTSSGALYYRELQWVGGEGSCLVAATERDERGALFISYAQTRKIRAWDMTFSGDFYYQDLPTDWHWDAATLLRLHPADSALYQLNAKYILPIGYQGANIFLCDWDSADLGTLCFNDLFEPLHFMQTGSYAYGADFTFSEDGYFLVPAALFEDTVLTHFDISRPAFRETALYLAEKDAYPWMGMNGADTAYFPALLPEVTAVAANPDGSMTLTVNVMCLDAQTDRLFTHEVTVLPLSDGGFRYLGNRITYRSSHELPSIQPGIPEPLRTKPAE